MCYTIYLYHSIIISLLLRLTIKLQTHFFALDLWIQVILIAVPVVGICTPLFMLFERPFMRKDWPHRAGNFLIARKPRLG
jgi:peptidoglycan/LPS O-acetylase OafA/YrhL